MAHFVLHLKCIFVRHPGSRGNNKSNGIAERSNAYGYCVLAYIRWDSDSKYRRAHTSSALTDLECGVDCSEGTPTATKKKKKKAENCHVVCVCRVKLCTIYTSKRTESPVRVRQNTAVPQISWPIYQCPVDHAQNTY